MSDDLASQLGNALAMVEPESRPDQAAPDASDLARLLAALQAHVRGRQAPSIAEADDRQAAILRAVCLALVAGSPELGVKLPPSRVRDPVHKILHDVRPDGIAEARVCRLWLSCVFGEGAPSAADEFASLASEPLWEPVQALAYRALAYFGRRNLLADLLPKEGPLSLSQADAWLEASHAIDSDEHLMDRIISVPDCSLPPAICNQWAALLRAEMSLARGDHPEATEGDLAALVSLTNEHPPRTYAEAESQRIAARAAAALVRARVAQRRDDGGVLISAAGRLLPTWEREYLQALVRWQLNDYDGASAGLNTALEHNPHQTPVRLALAALLANSSPEAALDVLDYNEPTREMLVAQAALLARLGRYGEADNTLAHCDEPTIRSEPARYSWALGREQSRWQAYALRTALAEHRADWDAAGRNWQATCAGGQRKTLQEARQIFAAHRELQSLPTSRTWRRDVVTQRLERGRHEIGAIPLVGDAMFFRAVAVMDTLPERAAKDFQTLLRRRAWVEAERRVGGGRIIFAGDALLRLGQVRDAIHAYELVGDSPPPEVKERLAVASVYAEILHHAEPLAILSVADRALSLAPDSPWPRLFAMLGLLIAGDVNSALPRLEAAEESGAPEIACRCLRSLCAIAAGTPATVADEDLAALRPPEETEAVIRLLCGAEPEPARIEAFVRAFGEAWIAHCPTDPSLMARRLLTAWCNDGKWGETLKFVDELARSGKPWAVELATLVRARHALERAGRGELEEAERELGDLEALLPLRPAQNNQVWR